jgi:hypothetical protein
VRVWAEGWALGDGQDLPERRAGGGA